MKKTTLVIRYRCFDEIITNIHTNVFCIIRHTVLSLWIFYAYNIPDWKKGCERSFYVVECGFGMTVRVSENTAVRVFTLTNRLCLLNWIVSRWPTLKPALQNNRLNWLKLWTHIPSIVKLDHLLIIQHENNLTVSINIGPKSSHVVNLSI